MKVISFSMSFFEEDLKAVEERLDDLQKDVPNAPAELFLVKPILRRVFEGIEYLSARYFHGLEGFEEVNDLCTKLHKGTPERFDAPDAMSVIRLFKCLTKLEDIESILTDLEDASGELHDFIQMLALHDNQTSSFKGLQFQCLRAYFKVRCVEETIKDSTEHLNELMSQVRQCILVMEDPSKIKNKVFLPSMIFSRFVKLLNSHYVAFGLIRFLFRDLFVFFDELSKVFPDVGFLDHLYICDHFKVVGTPREDGMDVCEEEEPPKYDESKVHYCPFPESPIIIMGEPSNEETTKLMRLKANLTVTVARELLVLD